MHSVLLSVQAKSGLFTPVLAHRSILVHETMVSDTATFPILLFFFRWLCCRDPWYRCAIQGWRV